MTIENVILDSQVHTFLRKQNNLKTPFSVVKMFAYRYNETV